MPNHNEIGKSDSLTYLVAYTGCGRTGATGSADKSGVLLFTGKNDSIKIFMRTGIIYISVIFRVMKKVIRKILVFILLIPLYIYKWFISPLTGPSCRHTPTCSQYAVDALMKHGPLRGFLMAGNRFSRCRPGGTHGYDPVPGTWVKRYRPWKTYTGRWPRDNRLKH